ncbi:carbohydrate-binding family 9-like protein [Pontibacter mangrovi]|uniref:Carbohydrate-binding domain-containing protein n=1 Tax=Pontibacter mangrovi TaxID=2589816 RepID=A0A501W3R8_9BACT|nr:carbohydrate-binding family 9-like protein [Pontibacter mangrovi]TPE43928.1 hypothetical protein FJM65_10915 [Pontibacter mangrovi]
MKHLTVPHLPDLHEDAPMWLVEERLNTLPRQQIGISPWSGDTDRPEVEFILAHNGSCLFLKYSVHENAVLARYRNLNDPVYKDSCVELFLSFGNDKAYYNLETNCLGTSLLAYGTGREGRKFIAPEALAQIKHSASLKINRKGKNSRHWQLTQVVPLAVFTEHRLEHLSGLHGRANLYKCGDDLPEPHFLTWSPVQAPAPDFHRPECFGQVAFA